MRVAVTGASGEFGSAILPVLLRRGHEVVGVSRRPHDYPHARYSHVSADVRDPKALAEAFAGVDAVVHLAWTTHPLHDVELTHAIDVGGTKAVLEAMQDQGVGRLVFTSSVMAYGSQPDNPARLSEDSEQRPNPLHVYQGNKGEAEQAITASGVPALMIRATNIMDRHCTGVTQQAFAGPAILGFKGCNNRMQFIHGDDLSRFYADAVEADWAGPVNLAAQDTITMREIAEIVGRRYVEIDHRLAMRGISLLWNRTQFPFDVGVVPSLAWFPIADNTRLVQEFGWEPAWTSRECVEDFAEWNREHLMIGSKLVGVPWRWPIGKVPPHADATDGLATDRVAAGPPEATGEFDSTVDPRYDIFTAANTSEAFPGPMTPLSLELAHESLSAAGSQNTDVLALDGELRRILTHEQVAVFGHGIYANMSVVLAMANAMPGNDVSAWEDMLFGGTGDYHVPELNPIGTLGLAKRLPRLLAKGATFDAETKRLAERAKASQVTADHFSSLSASRLRSELAATREDVASCWSTAAQGAVFITAVMAAVEKQAGKRFAAQFRGGTAGLESAGIAQGVHDLAEMARSDAALDWDLRCRDSLGLDELRRRQPAFADRLDQVLTAYGHRGPQEGELSHSMFADVPSRLIDTVAKLLDAPERAPVDELPMGRRLRALGKIGAHFQRARERVRDATMRETHRYRLIARELGRRMAADGILETEEDVFYLIRSEVMDPPPEAREIVSRRRAERDRLRHNRPPISFTRTFEAKAQATATSAELVPGDSIEGSGVSAGTAKGRVRVATIETIDELEPGDILVAEFTDVGWTPFFAFAGAVVVDTGGDMSHAAVVAREFGIPCVVATKIGSQVLKDGHLVEVDGASGLVTRVE